MKPTDKIVKHLQKDSFKKTSKVVRLDNQTMQSWNKINQLTVILQIILATEIRCPKQNRKDNKMRCREGIWFVIASLTQQEHSRLLHGHGSTKCATRLQTKPQRAILSIAALEQMSQSSAFPFIIPTLHLKVFHIQLLPLSWFHSRIPIPHLPEIRGWTQLFKTIII